MTTGAVVLVVAVVLAAGLGVLRLARDGRFRAVRDAEVPRGPLQDTPYADRLGERVTLVQFSSAFCAPCRAARRVLAEAAAQHPGVVHLEVDAESHLDLVRAAGVLRTPTTLVLDAQGRERTRASGAPTRDQVTAALAFAGVS